MSELVRFEPMGPVGVITLDRPPVNAISAELVGDLEAAVDEAADPSIRAVVLTGSPHFAAGADITAFKAGLDEAGDPAMLGADLSRVLASIEQLPKPVIAAIRGSALGGGMELALACDFRLLADDVRCGQPEILLGIFPGAGGTQRLPRLIGLAAARDLIYSGRHLDAEEALALGIGEAIHPADEVLDAAMDLAARYASGATVAIGLAKRAINQGLGLPLEQGLGLESELFAKAFETSDAAEGVTAFLEKREAQFNGE